MSGFAESQGAAARRRFCVRCLGDERSWQSDDPRVVFAMVLEFERRRRDGEAPPAVVVETRGAEHAALADALRRFAPWVEVRVANADAPADASAGAGTGAGAGPRDHGGSNASSPARPPSVTISPAELSMLFGPPESEGGAA